jgi:hypothetical protein
LGGDGSDKSNTGSSLLPSPPLPLPPRLHALLPTLRPLVTQMPLTPPTAAVTTSPKTRKPSPDCVERRPLLLSLAKLLPTMELTLALSLRSRVPPSSLLVSPPSLPPSTWPECEPPMMDPYHEILNILLNFDKNFS